MKVIEGKFGSKIPPADLSESLRELADAVDAGKIVSLIAAYINQDEYEFLFACNRTDAIVMTTLLQHRNVQRMMVDD